MMNNYQLSINHYPLYKDSGIEWLEELPSNWGVKRLKEILHEVVYGTSEKTKETGKYEVLGMGDIDDGKVSLPKKRFIDVVPKELLLKRGDLLFNRTNSLALVGKVGLIEEDIENVSFASYLIRLRVKNNQFSRYFWYFLNSENFIAYSRSNAIQTANQANLSSSKLKQFKIIYIPLSLQKAIAHYLDTKTGQIDRKIDLLTQKATLYSNLKQSLINETVTRGLDKSGPVKDSGIEWIGEVPEHWQVKRLKEVIVGALTYGANETATDSNPQHPRFIRITDFSENEELRHETFKSLPPEIAQKYLLKEGDILFARSGATVGKTFHFKNYQGKACYAGYLIKARPKPKILSSNFLSYYTKSSFYNTWKSQIFIKATIENISAEKYGFFLFIPIPSVSEQKMIIDYLDTKTAQIDQIIQTINTQIEKLKELRKILINDVVTGKIKVTQDY